MLLAILCFLSLTGFCFDQEGLSPLKDAAKEDSTFTIVNFTPDMQYTADGDYTISSLHSDILSHKAIREGWGYTFCKGTEPVATLEE